MKTDLTNNDLKKELNLHDEVHKADDLWDKYDTGLYDSCRETLYDKEQYYFVKKNGLWGLINDKGNSIMPCVLDCDDIAGIVRPVPVIYNNYDDFEAEDEDYEDKDYDDDYVEDCKAEDEDYFFIIIRKGGFWGCVDKNGNEVIPCAFDSIDNHFVIEYSEQKQMDVFLFVTKDNKIGLWNSSGEELTSVIYDEIIPDDATSPDDIISSFTVRLGNQWGIISLEGEEIVPCQFEEVHPYHNLYRETEGERPPQYCAGKRQGKWGAFNEEGDLIIPFDYDEIGQFNYWGIVDVRLNGKAGCINSDNEIIIPIQYDNVIIDSEGYYVGVELDGKWGIWAVNDGQAAEKLPLILDNIEYEYDEVYSQKVLYTMYEGEKIDINGALIDRLTNKEM